MSLNYQKKKDSDDHGSLWTSYSDLFMGLSFVFLLLYVTASLRAGTSGIQQQIMARKVAMENEDLKNQLKVYDALKKDYLETDASADEAKMYEDLMGKLDLLQDEAKTEKEKLLQASKENAQKEVALNKYQQMIRNVINSNAVAKARIKKRNVIIDAQDEEILEQGAQIEDLESSVAEKRNQIAAREKQIEDMNASLTERMNDLKKAFAQNKLTEKKYQEQLKNAKAAHAKRMGELANQQKAAEQQLSAMNAQLEQTEGLLGQAEGKNRALASQLEGERGAFEAKVAQMQGEFAAQQGRDRAAFEAELGKEKLNAQGRAAKEAAYRAGVAKKERELADKIAGLKNELSGTSAELAKAKAEIDARKNVAKQMKDAFAKAGVKAEIDGVTGDVTLDFGDNYFDTGQADIKPEMAQILRKAFPVYAKSLMENKNLSGKIESVEIVGFASPTYQGRVIDPRSMKPEDRKAAEYNMDLSYQRARSIYQFVFNQEKMQFGHQKDVRNLVKVSGKSFFEANKVDRNVASESVGSFCKKYDCKKSQRVLIKFNVNPK